MSMVCPQCKKVVAQALQCPDCQVRLLYQAQFFQISNGSEEERFNPWAQTPWGRMAVGLILAQGLSFSVQQLLTAWWLASGDGEAQPWSTVGGLVLLHTLYGLGLLVGGALAGAGQHRGLMFGAFVGLVNGLIFLAMHGKDSAVLTGLAIYGQPLLHLVFGALGGWIGRHIWKPVPQILLPEAQAAGGSPAPRRRSLWPNFWAGPVHLGRVFFGAGLVVLGVVSSNRILDFVLSTSQGKLHLTSHFQAKLVAWEIAMLVIVTGAGFAGATTLNGLKQGLCVGCVTSLVFVGLQLGNAKATLENTLFMIISMIGFGAIGGWFGAALLPPVDRKKKRNRILTG